MQHIYMYKRGARSMYAAPCCVNVYTGCLFHLRCIMVRINVYTGFSFHVCCIMLHIYLYTGCLFHVCCIMLRIYICINGVLVSRMLHHAAYICIHGVSVPRMLVSVPCRFCTWCKRAVVKKVAYSSKIQCRIIMNLDQWPTFYDPKHTYNVSSGSGGT